MQIYRHLWHTTCLCWPNHVVSSRTNLPPVLFNHTISLNPINHPYSLCSRRIISPCLTNSTGLEGADGSAEGKQTNHINALTNISGSSKVSWECSCLKQTIQGKLICVDSKASVNHCSSLKISPEGYAKEHGSKQLILLLHKEDAWSG